VTVFFIHIMCPCLAPAGNKEPHGFSVTPSSWWDGEDKWQKKAKLVDWDKDCFTEQQRKRTI